MKTELEQQRENMKRWNEKRSEAERKGLEKFYRLKELFHPPLTKNFSNQRLIHRL